MRRRSLTVKVLLYACAALLFSTFAFFTMYRVLNKRAQPYFRLLLKAERDEAIAAYTRGGAGSLHAYLIGLEGQPEFPRYLTDAQGRDLVDGTDRSRMLHPGPGLNFLSKTIERVQWSDDGRYAYLSQAKDLAGWTYLSYYILVPLCLLIVTTWLALGFARSLDQLASTVHRFGVGDLGARIHSRRSDEIGSVANAFDTMADRIQTLLHAERQLLQDISHELCAPMARLSFAAAISATATDRVAAAQTVQREVDRLSEIVSGLIEITRLEGDLNARWMEEVPLASLLSLVVEECKVEAAMKHQTLTWEIADLPVITGNPELLRRAVENILRNALKYSPAGSTVQMTAAIDNSDAVIRVKDSGPGVPEDMIGRLFDPFFRGTAGQTPSADGLGLGLSIARRAIALHSGTIDLTNVEDGLLATIRIPFASTAWVSQAATSPSSR